jgi:hypothetical protein
MRNAKKALSQIRTLGYVILPGVIPRPLVDSLANSLDTLQTEDRERYGQDFLYRIGQEGFVINVGDRGEPFEWLLKKLPVIEVVDALLGSDAFLYLFQGVIVPPGGGLGAFPWKWHCDLYHILVEIGQRDFIPGVNCLFYLDDVDCQNGATWIIPGSQGLLEEEVPREEPDFMNGAAIQVQATAGSAVLFNPLLWHCAGANHTDKPRRAVKMLMIRDWIMPQMDYARSIRPEVLDRLDETALRILGHRSRIARSFEELRGSTNEVSQTAGGLSGYQSANPATH